MTIRNLEKLLAPRSVAFVGASPAAGTIGNTIARNLLAGNPSLHIEFVNPRHRTIEGRPCVGTVRELIETPDLAVIATPPSTIAGLAAELAERGTRAIIVISAGLSPEQRTAVLEAGRSQCVRVLGPNCIGLLLPALGLNASFAHRTTAPGKLAFLSQSGALVTAVIDWAAGEGIGFSHIVSLGDMSDVDFGDLLDYLAGDPGCAAILMYVEAITSAPKFMSAARRAARVKPVIAVKSGRHATAAKAAHSHTGALAGSDAAYGAAFRRAGIVRVIELHDLFAAAQMIAHAPRLSGERLAILTNGGGAGVLAADSLADQNGVLATLAPDTIAALDKVLPATWSKGNPVDIIGDAPADRFAHAIDALLADPASDAVLVIDCPTALASSTDIAKAVADRIAGSGRTKCVITNWLGSEAAAEARKLFASRGIPSFDTPAAAIDGFMQLVEHKRAQEALLRTPPAVAGQAPDVEAARRVIRSALDAGRLMLSEPEGKELLAAYGIPVVETRIVASPRAAATVAGGMLAKAGAVVLKILSDDITHKSDVGGVRLALETPEAVEAAARAMLARVSEARPDARLRGFTVSPFVRRPRAHELILGVGEDRTFGPLILFGAGGTSVEATGDTALALPPLDMLLAQDLMRRTRVHRLLQGYRDRPAADLAAIAQALVALSALTAAHPEIRELDVNPLLADETGVIALDARVRLGDPKAPPRVAMAIRPYPSRWERTATIDGIGDIVLRPIRPEDERLYARFFDKVTPEDRRLRLFAATKNLSHGLVARLTQIDYAREIAFVALMPATDELLGVVRFIADPDYREAEYAVLVRSDLKGKGLGWMLMALLIDYAREEGLAVLNGVVLADNTVMLAMCEELGFTKRAAAGDHGLVTVRLELGAR